MLFRGAPMLFRGAPMLFRGVPMLFRKVDMPRGEVEKTPRVNPAALAGKASAPSVCTGNNVKTSDHLNAAWE
jgi:hypothetical protein